jgi:parvulin-like peptidyl-prolyl isomerase
MNRTSKPLFTVLLAAVLVPAGARAAAAPPSTNAASPAGASSADALFGNPVVAKGKGFEIKRNQFDDEVIRVKSTFAARGQQLPPEQEAMLERQILDQLIQLQILKSKATDADKAAGKAEAEKKFAETKARLGSDEALNRQLKIAGLTQEEVLAKMIEAATAETVLKRELNVAVSEADAKKFYEENPSKFEEPETVHVAHILIGTKDPNTGVELSEAQKADKRKLADDLLKRARAGEDFAKLVKQYSDDPGSKDKGGEYTFPRGGQMVPEFEAAAFSLKTNQVSDIVTTQFGYHIIKLLEKTPAHKVEFSKADADIKEGLSQQAMQKQFPEYMAKLKKEADVEVLDDKLKSVETTATPSSSPGKSVPK